VEARRDRSEPCDGRSRALPARAGLNAETVADMTTELGQHPIEAERDGRTINDAIDDRATFTEGWAAARKGKRVEPWVDVQSEKTKMRRDPRRESILYRIRCGGAGRRRDRRITRR
jgi:hypothetical protein